MDLTIDIPPAAAELLEIAGVPASDFIDRIMQDVFEDRAAMAEMLVDGWELDTHADTRLRAV